MSSSSALIVATFLALAPLNAVQNRAEYRRNIDSPEDLAGYLGTVENGLSFGTLTGDRGVGTFGGSEDHTAILCARAGKVVQYSYCPVRFERTVGLPSDCVFAVGVSGVVAEKTGRAMEKYNRVSRRAAALAELWRAATGRSDPHLAAVLASGPDAANRMREIIGQAAHGEFSADDLLLRFEQYVAESEEIIPAVGDEVGDDLPRFGELVSRSQALGARCLGNQTPETLWLADSARRLGAAASSAFGAGFGGSVWALVRAEKAAEMLAQWSEQYLQAFPVRRLTPHFSPPARDRPPSASINRKERTMSSQPASPSDPRPCRRVFLARSATLAGATVAGGLDMSRCAHAAGSDVIRIGLIGCGGRGAGAVATR